MGNKATHNSLLVLPAILTALALGSLMVGGGDPPNPAAAGRELQLDMQRFEASLQAEPERLTAEVSMDRQAPAAPLAEYLMRLEPEARRVLVLAVCDEAMEHFDPQFEAGFEQAFPQIDLQLQPHPGRDAIDLMLGGRCDAAVQVGELSTREVHAGLRQLEIGSEVLALAVPASSPLQSLASWQLRSLLCGEIRNWSQLGCAPGAVTLAMPFAHGLAARAGRQLLDGVGIQAESVRVDDEAQVYELLLRAGGTIGLVRAASIGLAPMARLLPIDGVTPTRDNLSYGSYPFGVQVNLITSGKPGELAEMLVQFAHSEAGHKLLARRLSIGL